MAYGKNITSSSLNQHKEMAGAGQKGNFGVDAYPGRSGSHPDVGMSHAPMADAARSSAHGSMQGAPDHGPAGKDHFIRAGKA